MNDSKGSASLNSAPSQFAAEEPLAISEFIWNGLDADASTVEVSFVRSGSGKPESIIIKDDGHGITYEEAAEIFGRPGASSKTTREYTQTGRLLHGRRGFGRHQVFDLGEKVEWRSHFRVGTSMYEVSIRGDITNPAIFIVDKPTRSDARRPGTCATISHLRVSARIPSWNQQFVLEVLALYLLEYCDVKIIYDGLPLEVASAKKTVSEFRLPLKQLLPESVDCELILLEWPTHSTGLLHLCDQHCFSLFTLPAKYGSLASNESAYLKSSYLCELWERREIELGLQHPGIRQIVSVASDYLNGLCHRTYRATHGDPGRT
jgi:hypothetical protein